MDLNSCALRCGHVLRTPESLALFLRLGGQIHNYSRPVAMSEYGHPNSWKLPNSHRKGLEKITWLSRDVFQPNIRLMEEILHHIRSPKHGDSHDLKA